MTKIYLIRHAEAEGNLYRRVQGQYDSLITPNGYNQIAALGARFDDIQIDAVYSSDLFRTRTTAGALYKSRRLELHTDPALREVSMGVWEDRPWAEVARTDPEGMALFNTASPRWKTEGGESFQQVRRRMTEAIYKIVRRHEGQTVAVFSHGMAIRCALTAFHGLDVAEMAQVAHGDNTAVSLVQFDGDRAEVVFENDNAHLSDGISTLARQRWWKEEGGAMADANFWYRPMELKKEGEFYYECRRDAWVTIHGSLLHFDGDGFLRDARIHAKYDPHAVWCAMLGDEIAGILQLDLRRDEAEQIGWIPFYYLRPDFRNKGMGIQLLGQAISVYRPLGRRYLQLRCAPDNTAAQNFYHRNGFEKVGEAEGTRVPLDILQKYIGY